jgi:uncharacterized protein (DUF1501 family)
MPPSIPRRSFLSLGLGAALAASLGRRSLAAPKIAPPRACIVLYMQGGPSQIDTFDPKPGRPTGGEFKAITTKVAGLTMSEHLPGLAKLAPKLAVIRSLTSKEGNHARAQHLMHTGYPPQGGVDHPAFGSLVADTRGATSLPGYVAISGPGEDAGFLGAGLSPFVVADPQKPVRHLAPLPPVDDARFARRVSLRRGLEDAFVADHPGVVSEGQRAVGERAIATMGAKDLAAFALDGDPARAHYGEHRFGLGCLMARRLVEVGVPFVEVGLGGWDTHEDNFARVKALSAELDQGMSALIADLAQRGLLAQTLVLWLGDFGRTPDINGRGGRDHYPRCQSVVMAGGGVRGGVVVGATDADGREVAERPVTVPDLFQTVAHLLGIDAKKVRTAPSGRPVKTVDGGAVIGEIV